MRKARHVGPLIYNRLLARSTARCLGTTFYPRHTLLLGADIFRIFKHGARLSKIYEVHANDTSERMIIGVIG